MFSKPVVALVQASARLVPQRAWQVAASSWLERAAIPAPLEFKVRFIVVALAVSALMCALTLFRRRYAHPLHRFAPSTALFRQKRTRSVRPAPARGAGGGGQGCRYSGWALLDCAPEACNGAAC